MIPKFPVTFFALCGLTGIAWPCFAQESAPHPLTDLEKRFEESYAKLAQPIRQLNASYIEALKRLRATESDAGNLNEAMVVNAELEGFGEGENFNQDIFDKRKVDHLTLETTRAKYRVERERLWNLSRKDHENLLRTYRTALADLEVKETKAGNLEMALKTRRVREALDTDPKYSGDLRGSGALTARIHFVAKGEVELRYHGTKLPFKDRADDEQYIDGASNAVVMRVGDILVVSMRSTVVFRSFILAIETEDGKSCLPVGLDDYRYLGESVPESELSPDIKSVLRIEAQPGRGQADPEMDTLWRKKEISELSRSTSEWVKCGPGSAWHSYAVMIRKEKLVRLPSE